MPKVIIITCYFCDGAHLITLDDGRGMACPVCDMTGHLVIDMRRAMDVAAGKLAKIFLGVRSQ